MRIYLGPYQFTDAQLPWGGVADFEAERVATVPYRTDRAPTPEFQAVNEAVRITFSLTAGGYHSSPGVAEETLLARLADHPRVGTLYIYTSNDGIWSLSDAVVTSLPHTYSGVSRFLNFSATGRTLTQLVEGGDTPPAGTPIPTNFWPNLTAPVWPSWNTATWPNL
jgi:hypothetical protein